MKKNGKHTKSLNCRYCSEEVLHVGDEAVKVTCSRCVNKSLSTGIEILDDDEDEESTNEFTRND
jgi:hypothetical protein